jgi:hypothetical protein
VAAIERADPDPVVGLRQQPVEIERLEVPRIVGRDLCGHRHRVGEVRLRQLARTHADLVTGDADLCLTDAGRDE